MWFLEHETLFEGKRVWLRPGSQQLFGRTKPSDGDRSEGTKFFIDNKNVSRKHMVITVLAPPPEDGTKLHAKSQVEITDLSCRQGTVIDNAHTLKSTKEADGSITYAKTTLSGNEHTVKLSSTFPPFKIKWQHMVFTYATREKRDSATTRTRNEQLHAIDIKTCSEFVYGKTTHVVSLKRNLPKVLQGLVAGVPIVTPDYLDAVLNTAIRSVDHDNNYVPSKLEEDFDTWWPREKEYIPLVGAEPVPQPNQKLEPDPSRSEVFAGLTFVFLNDTQHSSLHQVIAGGGGKALLYDIHPGETTPEEYVDYVRSVAGKKKGADIVNGTLPVITVRLTAYPEHLEDWAANFVTCVDRTLNRRSILQNEFLDAIVTKDTSSLRRPPTDVMEVDANMASVAPSQRSVPEATSASKPSVPSRLPETTSAPPEEPAKTIPRKRPIRRGATSRFTGFDDYVPPTKVRKIEDTPVEALASVQEGPSQSVPATQTHHVAQPQVAETVERGDRMDELYPAAAAIKRQRAATRAPSASVEPESLSAAHKPKTRAERIEEMQKTKRRADKEINVREETRKRMAEVEEKRRAEEESLREALQGVDISDIRAAIQVEEMKLRRRDRDQVSDTNIRSDRWNPDWNGRKNFKKFRKRGTEQVPQSEKVLVTFEQVPQKKGFGDTFFLEDTAPPVRTKEDERRLKRRTGRGPDSDSEPQPGLSRRKRNQPAEVINVEDSCPDEDNGPQGTAPSERSSGRTQRIAETQLENTQTQTGAKKRGAVSVAAGQPSTKRTRTARRNDDSDEEETGFRFRRRR